MIFWRLRDLGLGRRCRGRLGAAAAGAGRDRRRAAGFTRGGSGAGRAGMPSSGHRRPPWRRAATAIGGAAMVMDAAGGAVRQRRCEPRGSRAQAAAAPRRDHDQLGCECGGGVARRQANSGRGSQPSPCPRASRWEAAVAAPPCRLPASGASLAAPERTRRRPSCRRPEHAQPGWEGCRPQLYSRHAVSLPTGIKGQVRFRLKCNQ